MARTLDRLGIRLSTALAASFLVSGCNTPQPMPATAGDTRAQLFDGMGPHRRATSTTSPEAQAYFDQALTWTYAFNHDEAIRSYRHAAELDPDFALAWWGVALCNGPHINNPAMTDARSELAWRAACSAEAAALNASEVERALIEAVATRYAWPAPADRRPLDEAYAASMRRVHERYPDDNDVTVLYVESLMDLQPWDLWTPDGSPKGNTVEIVRLLEQVLADDPDHPGAAHLYIHAVEASGDPGRALTAANTLRELVPASGHLTHMPSHIDAQVGHWSEAAVANRKAVLSDRAYRSQSPTQDFYRAYMLHNQQFLSFVCMMLGRSEESIAAGKAAIDTLPRSWVKDNASLIDGYLTVHMDALKRFGKWEAILALDTPPSHLPFTTAMWRCNRALALAALGRMDEAQAESRRFDEAAAAVPEGALAQINPARTVLSIARHVLDGELAYARRDYGTAERELRAAVALEDTLLYMEPPDWMLPVRHTLGTVLLDAGKPAEAEAVYREDLIVWPENGWALLGLAQSLERQGKSDEARVARHRLDRAWADRDITPHATCLCAPRGDT